MYTLAVQGKTKKMSQSKSSKYFQLYKYYKRKCSKLTLELQKMQRVMARCRNLLEDGVCQEEELGLYQQSGDLTASPIMMSTPKGPRKILFSTPEKEYPIAHEDASDEFEFEPGSNKWELIDSEEMLNHSFLKRLEDSNKKGKKQQNEEASTQQRNSLSCASFDLDETFYEPEEMTVSAPAQYKKLKGSFSGKSDEGKIQKQDKAALKFSPGHICRLPRCEKHQPFHVSSSKKIAKLSPKKRALASKSRQKSPKGYWDLELPSTQYIRSRNQDDSE